MVNNSILCSKKCFNNFYNICFCCVDSVLCPAEMETDGAEEAINVVLKGAASFTCQPAGISSSIYYPIVPSPDPTCTAENLCLTIQFLICLHMRGIILSLLQNIFLRQMFFKDSHLN